MLPERAVGSGLSETQAGLCMGSRMIFLAAEEEQPGVWGGRQVRPDSRAWRETGV